MCIKIQTSFLFSLKCATLTLEVSEFSAPPAPHTSSRDFFLWVSQQFVTLKARSWGMNEQLPSPPFILPGHCRHTNAGVIFQDPSSPLMSPNRAQLAAVKDWLCLVCHLTNKVRQTALHCMAQTFKKHASFCKMVICIRMCVCSVEYVVFFTLFSCVKAVQRSSGWWMCLMYFLVTMQPC